MNLKISRFLELWAHQLGLSVRGCYSLTEGLRKLKAFPDANPGRSGGAVATPRAIALFLEVVLAGASRATAYDTVLRVDLMIHEDSVKFAWDEDELKIVACPLTGKKSFGEALTAILADPDLANQVEEIVMIREWPEAVIRFRRDGKLCESRWFARPARAFKNSTRFPGAIETPAALGRPVLHQMAIDLADTETAEWNALVEKELNK